MKVISKNVVIQHCCCIAIIHISLPDIQWILVTFEFSYFKYLNPWSRSTGLLVKWEGVRRFRLRRPCSRILNLVWLFSQPNLSYGYWFYQYIQFVRSLYRYKLIRKWLIFLPHTHKYKVKIELAPLSGGSYRYLEFLNAIIILLGKETTIKT